MTLALLSLDLAQWLNLAQTLALVVATGVAVSTYRRTTDDRRDDLRRAAEERRRADDERRADLRRAADERHRDTKTSQFERLLEAVIALRETNALPPHEDKDLVFVPRAARRLKAAHMVATADGTRLAQTEILSNNATSDGQAESAQIEIVKAIETLRQEPRE